MASLRMALFESRSLVAMPEANVAVRAKYGDSSPSAQNDGFDEETCGASYLPS